MRHTVRVVPCMRTLSFLSLIVVHLVFRDGALWFHEETLGRMCCKEKFGLSLSWILFFVHYLSCLGGTRVSWSIWSILNTRFGVSFLGDLEIRFCD
jgi:hypothetical protein